MIGTLRELWSKRAIVGHFVGVHLTTSYRTKSLGFLWAVLDPLLFMGVYYLVFGQIIAQRPLSFMLHLFIGVIVFRFLQSSAAQGAGVLRSHGGVIKEIRFPKTVLPASVIAARLFDFAAGWLVAIPLAIIFGSPPSAYWLLIPFIVAIQIMFVSGFSLLTAYVGVFFADVENILNVLLRLWFYMSPILYDLALVRERTASHPILYSIYMANPMTNLVESYQALVARGELPQVEHVAYAFASSLVMLLIGIFIFSRAEGQIGKYV